jgi:chromosome segregation ATPase
LEAQRAAEREERVAEEARHVARFRELEGEMASLRAEAVRWECGLEARRRALEAKEHALAQAQAEVRQLGAACAAKDAQISSLRQEALGLARAELEAGIARREESARAEVELIQRDLQFKSRRWKRINEALRDRLAVVEARMLGHGMVAE